MKAINIGLTLFGVIWLSVVGVAGQISLWKYTYTLSSHDGPPQWWPQKCTISRTPGRSTLLMFVHPHCPCSQASLDELAKAMTRAGDRVDAYVLFPEPREAPKGWCNSTNWHMAASIPGICVGCDRDGIIAQKFSAATSGYVIVYGHDGALMFNGGITAGRGHSGDNAGGTALRELFSKGSTEIRETPVFGCPLLNPSDSAAVSSESD